MHRYRVDPTPRLDLQDHDPRDTSAFPGDKQAGRQRLQELTARLGELQEALYAEGRHRLLVVLQAMDAGGKDGTIRSVFAGVNPQGVRVVNFRTPSPVELAHDFLWRVHPHAPARGEVAIWNRSHYEDVLITRVHGTVPEARWRSRYEHIRAFEHLLVDEGTTLCKFFLHISKDEQRERLQERLDDPAKRWKWNAGDLEERARWDDYQLAYADAIAATSTEQAPWYVVPADRNWYRDLVVAEVLIAALTSLAIRLPTGDPTTATIRIP